MPFSNHETEMARRARTREYTVNNLLSELRLRETMIGNGVGDAGGGGSVNQPEIDPETGEIVEETRFWRVGDKVAQYPIE